MKTISTVILSLLVLTGCAQESNETKTPNPETSESAVGPTPKIADNIVPKSCKLPEVESVAQELIGSDSETIETPNTPDSLSPETYELYLEGLYLTCAYQGSGEEEVIYVTFRETDVLEWEEFFAQDSMNLEEGDIPFEQIALGVGEVAAYNKFEPEEQGGFWVAEALVDNVSVSIFSNVVKDEEQAKKLFVASLGSLAN
jgi:hypothetical protein